MSRIKALFLALVTTVVIVAVFYTVRTKDYQAIRNLPNNTVRYDDSYEKYKSRDLLRENIDRYTILLMGSSELTATLDCEEHPRHFLDYENCHIMQIGGGNFQSLIHAITLGSLGGDLPVRQVNLIISMQWFTKEGIDPTAFQSRVSYDHVCYMLKNPQLSEKTKQAVLNRIEVLTAQNSVMNHTMKDFAKKSPFNDAVNGIRSWRNEFQQQVVLGQHLRDASREPNTKRLPEIDWTKAREEAISRAKAETTNNDYYIQNEYYDTYIKKNLAKDENSATATTFTESPEYGDLQLFLDVAKELGYEVNLIMIPLQGKWADYTGVPKSEIEGYYEKIRTMARANGIHLTDYSKYSYEPYFFKDIMHLGRVGWIQLQEDLLKDWKPEN